MSKSYRDKSERDIYDKEIDRAKVARKSQRRDTDPRFEKDGFLGVDDLDRMRRRKVK